MKIFMAGNMPGVTKLVGLKKEHTSSENRKAVVFSSASCSSSKISGIPKSNNLSLW